LLVKKFSALITGKAIIHTTGMPVVYTFELALQWEPKTTRRQMNGIDHYDGLRTSRHRQETLAAQRLLHLGISDVF
jgi:hypothetical protein